MITIQVTLFSTNGYKPMSCLMDIESITYYQEHKKQIQNEAIQKICGRRSMGTYELKKYGYSKLKARVYNRESSTL